MGVYVSVRGWLECDKTQLAVLQEIISSHADDHYSNGWSTPRQHVNWTHYLFYGADIRESALDWLQNQIREIARIPASDEDGDRIRGPFLATHELDGTTEWQIREGQVVISPADIRHQKLDG
ncbi:MULTISPECIES: hypothetical protein [unclassified Streptomyces]|uniref:hypothetical protein n=1 Tax=unclassified Streptomyces TaxID=2593676 RepID=UPI00081DDFB5|nr:MULTISPECIES: hypothetical protein [unclassified Streptomyces]SCF95470.1 hypothetical protein GA0115259_105518 [Streptomyces sp. MnatMP-M17]